MGFPGFGLNRIFWTASQLPLFFACLWPYSCAACRALSNALGTAATAVLREGQVLLLFSACGHAAGQDSPWILGCSPRCPAGQGCLHQLGQEADVSALSLAPWMGVITSIITQELEVGRKRSFVWVVREKRGWLRRQGSESANHAKPVLCQAGNN